MTTKIRWIVQSGIFLALLIVLQTITKPLGPLVTGSIVNFILIATTLLVGITSGTAIGLISPFLAMLLGIVQLPIYIVPVVSLGNLAIVLVFGLVLGRVKQQDSSKKVVTWIFTIAVGAVIKFSVLYAGVNWIVVPLVTTVQGVAAKAPAAVFSTLQMLTAVIGGILALLIVPAVKKAISR